MVLVYWNDFQDDDEQVHFGPTGPAALRGEKMMRLNSWARR